MRPWMIERVQCNSLLSQVFIIYAPFKIVSGLSERYYDPIKSYADLYDVKLEQSSTALENI